MTLYPVSIGDQIAGKYLVERFIGEGGMGLVVAARHVELDQPVAIKFLLPQIAEHVTAAQRFRREARAAARIRGEHACRVLDVATLDNGVPYMVMEYLEGCDLSMELLRRGRLPPEEAVDYVLQACEALAEAHSGGIIHRDLKPGNFFLAVRADGTRCLKVLDFGVSKLLADSDASPLGLTSTATMIGSPLYMSPEQLESAKDVDARTDIWGLGVVLYELVTGRTPFLADSLAQLTHQVLSAMPPSPATLGVQVQDGLEAIIMRALAKRRTERFASVADLARALVPYGPSHGAVSAARVARLSPGSTSRTPSASPRLSLDRDPSEAGLSRPRVSASGTPASWERKSTPTSNRKQIGLAALALALMVLGVVAWRLGPGATARGPEVVGSPAPAAAATVPPGAPAQPPVAPTPPPVLPPAAAANMDTPPSRATAEAGAPAPAAPEPAKAEVAEEKPKVVAAPPAAVVRPAAPKAVRNAPPAPAPTPAAAVPREDPVPAPSGSRVSDFGGRR